MPKGKKQSGVKAIGKRVKKAFKRDVLPGMVPGAGMVRKLKTLKKAVKAINKASAKGAKVLKTGTKAKAKPKKQTHKEIQAEGAARRRTGSQPRAEKVTPRKPRTRAQIKADQQIGKSKAKPGELASAIKRKRTVKAKAAANRAETRIRRKKADATRSKALAESKRVTESLPKRTGKLTKSQATAKAKASAKGVRFQGGRPKGGRGKPTLRNQPKPKTVKANNSKTEQRLPKMAQKTIGALKAEIRSGKTISKREMTRVVKAQNRKK